ncbi:hypothetical protein D9M69_691420 [compost metagenome]
MGALHDALGGWGVALGVCAALCVAMAVTGLYAGRSIQIGQYRGSAPAVAAPSRR